MSDGVPQKPERVCLLNLVVNHEPHLLVENVAQQSVCEEAPRIAREHLVVSVDTVVYSAGSKHDNECSYQAQEAELQLTRWMILPTEQVPNCNIETCCYKGVSRGITVFKSAPTRLKISYQEWSCLVIQALQYRTERLAYNGPK